MGNALITAYFPSPRAAAAATKLIFWGGATRLLPASAHRLAGELMFQFPDSLVCRADSFFIGQPIPSLTIQDELISGETYFVLPSDHLPCGNLTASSLALLSSAKGKQTASFGKCPFEYGKGRDGKARIRVLPEFIEGMISQAAAAAGGGGGEEKGGGVADGVCEEICSTPELRKQYEQLVGSKHRPWSPGLETIRESSKARVPPTSFFVCGNVR